MKKLGIMMAATMLLIGTATFASATTPAKTAKVTKTEQTAKPKVHHKHHKGHKKAVVAATAK